MARAGPILDRFLTAFAEELGRACARAMAFGITAVTVIVISRIGG
jgi:hypothetical protein